MAHHGADTPGKGQRTQGGAKAGAHTAVKHELLVRYLDAWTPAVLHGHRRATYVEGYADDDPGGSAVAALRVFGEFADLLDRHTLVMILIGEESARLAALATRLATIATEVGAPEGLTVHAAGGGCARALLPTLRQTRAFGSPIFGWFDSSGSVAPPFSALAAVAGNKGSDVLLSLDPGGPAPRAAKLVVDYRRRLAESGLDLAAHLELVDQAGHAELLIFATSSEKELDKFKDELWSLDEYAGIRYRDPLDDEQTLLDISLRPNVGPLRRALTQRLIDVGESTMASLRTWAVRHTLYRAADVTTAVQALLAAGQVERSPTMGRLSPDTMIRPKEPGGPMT